MKILLLLLLLFGTQNLYAQDESYWPEASKESKAYHDYRTKSSIPPYGLAKVKALVAIIKSTEDENLKLNDKDYLALSLREKFTYHMIHAEAYSQNCDVMPPILEEHKKIFGYLPDAFDEYSWSERQTNFMTSNKDSVLGLIKESAKRSKRLGVNYKMAIVEMNAKQMIPFLISFYKTDKKDYDILTVLMLLMKKNEYKPFKSSASFKKLYSDEASYQAYLDFNKANEELILKRAMDFYDGK